jgi:hypothetical protein
MQHWNMKRNISAATVIHATIEELWETVFSMDPCRGYIDGSLLEFELGGRESETARVWTSSPWQMRGRQRCPHCCKPLRINAETCCEIDASLRGRESGSTQLRDLQLWVCYQTTTGEDTADWEDNTSCSELQSVWISDRSVINCSYEL